MPFVPVSFPEFSNVSAAVIIPQVPLLAPYTTNLFGDGLKIEWDISRTRGSDADTGTVKIYNLSFASRGLIQTTWALLDALGSPMLCSLSLGWGGIVGQVMMAQVWKIDPEQRIGEDVVTTLHLGDGIVTTRDAVLGASFANTTIDIIIKFLVINGLKAIPDPASLAIISAKAAQLPVQLWQNYVVSTSVGEALDDLLDTLGLEWKILDGIWLVTDQGNAATASPVSYLLSAQSGLLTWQRQDSGVIATALANPNVQPGSAITVLDSFNVPVGAPQHRVDTISFAGATDGDSTMSIGARAAILVGGVL